jgi:hypothetical protein
MTANDLWSGKVLQAPIYALAARQLFGLDPLGAEFAGLRQGETRGIYRQGITDLYGPSRHISELTSIEWEDFLTYSEERLCQAVQAMRDGEISLSPTSPRCPDRCEFFALCRGERFTLARRLRNLNAGKE